MKLSMQTGSMPKNFGERITIEKIAKAGFDTIDYTMNDYENRAVFCEEYISCAEKLKSTAENLGCSFNQVHAPFPSAEVGRDEFNEIAFQKLKRSIEFAGILGAKQIIVHPVTFINDHQKTLEYNIEFYKKLEDTACRANIKIALENMFWCDEKAGTIRPGACGNAEWFCELYDKLNPENFTCCLDIGHCGLVGERAHHMINSLGHKRLGALHVHDNDFKDDRHTLPFTGSIDFKEVAKALSNINYKGDFTFECAPFLSGFPTDLYDDALKLVFCVGKKLISMIENQ